MSDLPVSHYLDVYEHRLSMSERGVTHPAPAIVEGMRRLITALRTLKPDEKISLDATGERAIFTKSVNRELIARIDFNEKSA